MKEIQLKHGVVKIDDDDFALVARHGWWAHRVGKSVYAATLIDGHKVFMHRLIVGTAHRVTDHIDGDGLNNQRSNLRKCSYTQNQYNRRKFRGTSLFKGVQRRRGATAKPWLAVIKLNGKQIRIGRFADEETAARAYDAMAVQHFGEFARPNF